MSVHWQVTFASYLGKTYTVSIYDDSYSGDVVPLTPAAEPFYTEDDADSDILTPMRTQTGYLRVIAQNDLTALYPTTPTSRPVTMTDENSTIVWHGYIGCESYSQPWDATPYELELPLVSSIGVLQFIEIESGEIQDRAHIARYISTAITKSGGNFTTLVFPTTFSLDSYGTDVFMRLGIQERNWFSYTNENMYDKTYPRYDGMTWYDVLEAICTTFGLTLYERGTTLYMVQRGEERGHATIAVSNLPSYYGLDAVTTTAVTSTDVNILSLTISDKNGKVNTSMPAGKVVVESQVNALSEDSFPQMSTLYLQYHGTVQVTKAYTGTGASGDYFDEEVGVYGPTTEGANIWHFSSYNSGSETTWDGQDLARDYSISAYVRRDTGDDAIMFVYNSVPGATGYPTSYFSIKSASSATFLGGKMVIKCGLDAYEGEGLSLKHQMQMKVRIGSYYWTGSAWSTTESTFTAYFNASNKLSEGFTSDKEGLRIKLPSDASIYGEAEITMWTPQPEWVQASGVEGVYMIENLEMSYEHPEGSVFGDHPVSDTNRFAKYVNIYGEEKAISPMLSSYIYWRFGYGVILKPDYSGAVEKVDVGQSQAHEGEDEVYLEKRLLWAMEYYYSTTQRDITIPVRTSTIYSPLTFFIDHNNGSHYFLAQATNWRDDEHTIKIFDNLQAVTQHSSPALVNVSGEVTTNGFTKARIGSSLEIPIVAEEGYSIVSVRVVMNGVDISASYSNGVVSIQNVTGDVSIYAVTASSAPAGSYSVTVSGNVNEAGSSTVSEGDAYSITLTTADNYSLDSATVTMGGVDITASAYNNGVVTIASVTGNVVITAVTTLLYDAEVEYLAASGTQYIDTGYYPNTNTVLEAKYRSAASKSPFAARWTGASTYDTFGAFNNSSSKCIFYYGRFSDDESKTVSISSSSVVTLTMGLTQLTVNSSTTSITRSSFTSTYPMYLFCMNNMGSATLGGNIRIYSFKITEGNTTILDMIPVRVGTTGYMYDKVSRQLFGNAGSGTFTYGSDI